MRFQQKVKADFKLLLCSKLGFCFFFFLLYHAQIILTGYIHN